MSQNHIREAMHGAKRDYPNHVWEMESGFESSDFLLHGHSKEKIGLPESRRYAADPDPQASFVLTLTVND